MRRMTAEITLPAGVNGGGTVDAAIAGQETLGASLGNGQGLSAVLALSGQRSGGSGTYNYNDLYNKPQIEGVTLEGNKTFPQLKLQAMTNLEIYMILREE